MTTASIVALGCLVAVVRIPAPTAAAPAFVVVPSPSSTKGGRTRPRAATALRHHRRSFLATAASWTLSLPFASSSTPSAHAITPQEASNSYDIYAPTYDDLDGGTVASSLGIDDARRKLLSMARGDVLEVGVGTGLNLEAYPLDAIRSLTLVDVSEGMLSRARERVADMKRAGTIGAGIKVEFARADATSELISMFGENKFDTVVDTFSLCVMGNEGAERCLGEMAGIVKKGADGGQILLIENTRASNPLLGYYQDVTASAAADMGGKGCVYNQNVGDMIRRTKGLRLAKEEAFAAGLFRSFVCQKI